MRNDDFEQLKSDWDALGIDDPFWAVLSLPEKKGGGWTETEFFATGEKEITTILARAAALRDDTGRERALDFGCGPGRLSQALAHHFREVHGVDIAPSMIQLANRLNRFGERCQYQLLEEERLPYSDGTFDFVYSTQTLQHIARRSTYAYITEFLRVLGPSGMLVFQIPDRAANPIRGFIRRVAPRPLLRRRFRRKYGTDSFMDINTINRRRMTRFLAGRGATVLDAEANLDSGIDWPALRYYVVAH